MGTLLRLPGTFCEICKNPYTTGAWGRQSLTFGFCCVRCVNKACRVVRRHNRRARTAKCQGTLYAFDWLSTLYAHDFSCASCQAKGSLTLDHIRPLSLGGQNLTFNIQPLCPSCHGKKDNIPGRLSYR